MKIIDCFPFFDEFLMLDIRFRELYDLVDKFVIVESRETFSGKEKPLYLTECLNYRYPQYADKIEIIVPKIYDDTKPIFEDFNHSSTAPGIAWRREYFQKNHISYENLKYLDLDDNDIVLYSDADEIPCRWIIKHMRENGLSQIGKDIGYFGGPTYYYKLNILTSEWSHRPGWSVYKKFKNHTENRYIIGGDIINQAGWHFSYIKSPEKIKEKIEAFSHQEFNTEEINNIQNISDSIDNIKDIFGRSEIKLSRVEIDDSFPEYIKENKEFLKEWIA